MSLSQKKETGGKSIQGKLAQEKLITERLISIYQKLLEHFGPRGWWPGESVLEVCIGAILTQSVSWKNVTKAIDNLKNAALLDLNKIYHCSPDEIEKCIIPAMYFRVKAKKLKVFISHVVEKYNGDFTRMFSKKLEELREELLNIYGIGPETADSIILYAAQKPVFVVDAYTRRVFSRLGFYRDDISYDEMQGFFMRHLPSDVSFFNEFHALIVGIGNSFCSNKKPKCSECPVNEFCYYEKY